MRRVMQDLLLPTQDTTTEDELATHFETLFRDNLAKELERCYSPDLSKLPRRGRTGNGSAPRIIVSHNPPGEDRWTIVFRIRDGSLTLEPDHESYASPTFSRFFEALNEDRFTRRLGRLRRAENTVAPVYFPAARSGYVQMRHVLSSLLIAALGRGYFDQVALGKISGVAADFLQFLAGLEGSAESKIPIEAVDRLEQELLHGRITLTSAGDAPQMIEFAPEGLDEFWPMDSAATSIVEVAPLLLYLRHSATSRDLLFIDEPEAHLHPQNQLVLADVLLDLASLIEGMVIGTHSEFFVTGVSNGLLRRRAADPDARLAARLYQLVPAQTTGGYELDWSDIDDSTGFSVEQFSTVAEAALDEGDLLFERIQTSG